MSEWKETDIGLIPENWSIQLANQYCPAITDGTHDSPKSQSSGYPLITSKHIKGSSIDFENAYLISKDDYFNIIKRSKVDQYDLIVSMIGEYCGFTYLETSTETNYAVKNVGLLKNRDLINARWLMYYLRSPIGSHQLRLNRGGTSQPYISLQALRNLLIAIPSSEIEKREITETLASLDRKISNLRQQNETLESIAQTLFKYWFVDFEFPNEDGKPYKSSGGAMVRSDLGDIPVGWEVGKLGDLFILNYGKSLTFENRFSGDYPVVGSSGIVGNHRDYLVKSPGIVIGRKGTIGEVIWLEEHFNPIDTTFYVEDVLGCNGLYFYYFLIKNQNFKRLTSDSAVPGLNRDMAYSIEIAIPKINKINKFNTFAKSVFNKINLNHKQIQTLTQTRDRLLPKLMSGQLRIPE